MFNPNLFVFLSIFHVCRKDCKMALLQMGSIEEAAEALMVSIMLGSLLADLW